MKAADLLKVHMYMDKHDPVHVGYIMHKDYAKENHDVQSRCRHEVLVCDDEDRERLALGDDCSHQ